MSVERDVFSTEEYQNRHKTDKVPEEASIAEAKEFLASSNNPAFIKDATGKFTFANIAFLKVIDVGTDLIGKDDSFVKNREENHKYKMFDSMTLKNGRVFDAGFERDGKKWLCRKVRVAMDKTSYSVLGILEEIHVDDVTRRLDEIEKLVIWILEGKK